MRKILLIISVFVSAIAISQPANDNCANATSLGSLPAPGACTAGLQNGAPVTLNSQTTVGATGSNPYNYLGNCEGGTTDMESPALDTWYSFVATGTTVNIAITGFTGANIGLWEGTNCNNLSGRGCSVDGALTVTQITAGNTYYIQVSGNTATATDGSFTLAVDNDIDCNNCLRAATITASPAPINGAYQAGQTVTFCFKINQWVQQNTNWLHGVQVTLGSGWNATTLTGNPPGSYSTLGDWVWYNPGPGNANGTNWGTGFYYDYGAGTDPRNNLGDNNTNNNIPNNQWNFCVTVTAASACTPGSDLSISFNTSGDGESGSWTSSGCVGDYPTVYSAVGACCPPGLTVPSNVTCFGGTNGSITATPVGSSGPYTYAWTGPSGYTNTQTNVAAGNTITGLAAGTYTLNLTDANSCLQTATVTVTQPTQVAATVTPTNPTCTGTGSIAVTGLSGGTSPYDISIDNGSNYTINNVTANQNITGLSAGSYTVVVRDNNGCIRTFPVTTLTATGSVVASFAVPAAQCLTGNSYSFTPLTTGSSAGSIVAGTTTYDFNFGNGNNPAATTSTAAQTVTYAAAGTYTVSLTVTSGSCTNTFTAAVIVNPMPALPTATLVQPTCGLNNGSITITGPGTTYSLNNAAGPYSGTTSYTNQAPGTYTVYVRNGTTCTSSQTFTLTNIPGPTAIATTTTTAHCGQSDGSITLGAVTGGTSTYTYSVTPTVGFSGTTVYTGQASGTHTVTVRDANTCTYTTTVNVPNAAGPTAQVLTPTPANCGTATGQVLFGATTGGSAPYTYSFNGSAYTTTTTYSSLLPGTYNAGVTDNFGCTYTTTVNVASNPGPTALALTSVPANCGATNGSINIGAVTGGTAGFTYSFNNVAGPFTATSPITGLAAGTYSVTVRDVNGCVFTNTVSVTASSGPTDVVLTSGPATCGASNGTVTIGAVTGGAGVITYSLDGSPFNTTTSFTGQSATTHTVIVRDGNGCEYTETIGVSSSTGPTALAVTSTPSACVPNDGTVTIGAVTGGTGPYQYSFNGSALSGTTNYTGVAAGVYPVSVSDANTCVFATTVTVDPSLPPTAIVTTPVNSTCGNANGTVAYGAVTGGTPGYTYSFNNSAYGAATSYTIAAGTYNVGVRDSKGCTYTTTVTVLNTPGPTDLVLTPTSSTCGNNNGQVVVTTTTGGTSNYTYTIDGGVSQASTTFTGLSAITHTVVVTDANGCTYTETIGVANLPGPTAQAVTTGNSTCGNTNGTLTIGATTGGTGAITWQVDLAGGFTATTNYTGLVAGTHTVEVRDANLCPLTVTVTINNTPGPTTVALSQTPSNCGTASGSVVVGTVTGGTAGYTYSIDGGTNYQAGTTFSSLLAGTYTITVKDANNCLTTNTITVNNVGAPTVTLTAQTPVTCFGLSTGTASFSATGGAGGFTYTLNTGSSNLTGNFTNLAQGTYTVTVVDAASCPATQTVTIVQPTALSGSIVSQTDPLCNGGTNGSLQVTGLNATPGYTYSLNGGASQASGSFGSLAAGGYTVTVTDSRGCTFPVPVTLSQPTPVLVVMSSSNANCTAANGTATATPSGGTSGYTYAWLPSGGTGATTVGVVAGTYSVTVTDAQGCTATGNTTVGVTPGGTATISSVTQVDCNGGADGSITVSMSATAATSYTYTWLPSGGSAATASGLAAGTYTVNVVDNFGCTATANAAVTEPLPLVLSLTSTNVSCNGGSDGTITSNTTGGTVSYNYVWSHGASSANVSGLPIGTYTLNITDSHGCPATANVTLSQPTPLAITPVVTNANCNQADGSFTVTASGGAGGYSYSLNAGLFINPGSFTNLSSGTYTVTVRDGNNCESSFPVTVGDNAGPTASITSTTHVSCFAGSDGTATITASGGTNTFVYLWSNGSATPTATGLAAGIYTVTATDGNGCVASTGVTITQPTQLVANASGTDPLCNGGNTGTGLAGALGGTPPYTYSWTTLPTAQTTPAATGLIAGSYNVIVTDNKACQATASITLVNPPALTASITPVDLDCFNQCIGTATAIIGNAALPIQYTWTGGQTTATATGLCAGSYTVNVIDGNSCTATANTTINQPTQLVASIPTSGNESCFNTNDAFAQGTASGGTPGYTFTWSNTFVGANNTNLDAGTYTLTVTDSKGCTDVEQVTVTAPPAIGLTVTKTDITCNYAPPYPPINDGTAFATATGGTAPYQFLWQPMLYTVNNPVTLQAGSHTVVVTDDNGCKDSTTIFINEPPEFTIALESDSSNCHFSNGATNVVVTGGATPHTIAWSNGVSTPYNPGLPAGQYDIVVTDAVGCLVNGTAVVEDIEGPNVTITDSTNITCFGANNGAAVAVANGGVLPYMSLGWAGTTQSGLSAVNLGPGPATILVYDAAGCLGSDQTFIMEPSDVVGAIVSYQDVTCYNLFNGNAVVQATGGLYPTDTNTDNAYTISLYNPVQTQAGVAPNSSISFVGLGVGPVGSTHTYTVMVTDVRGCKDSTTVTISQPQALVISNPIETNITCFGLSNGQISVTATGGTPVYSYNWTSSNVGFVNPGTPAISGLQAGSYTLSLVDANGCTDNQTAAVIEPTQIMLDSSAVTATCGLANGSATVLPSGGTPFPGGAYVYQWNTSPNQITQTATGLSENVYNVQVTDLNGCIANTDVVVPNATGPSVANITSYAATCFGTSTGAADVDAIGGTSPLVYTWTNSNGTILVSGPSPNDSVVGIPSGTYNVNVVDANGCFFNSVSVVAQPSQLNLIVSADQTMCYGDSVQIYANIGGGTPPYTWAWLHNGASVPAYNVTSGSLATGPYWISPSYLTPLHTYSVSLVDANSCPVAGQTIDITALPPITISSSDQTACNLSMVTLSANASGGNTSIGGDISYNWTPGSQTTNSITVQAQDGPTHQMIYIVTASDGCSRDTSITVVVNINPKPIASFVGFNLTGCEDLAVNFAAGNPGMDINNPVYSWNLGDNSGVVLGSAPNHTYTNNSMQTITYDVEMTVTSDQGCTDTLTMSSFVTVYPTPVAAFTFDPLNTTEFDPEINFYDQSLLGNTYEWNFGEIISQLNTSTETNPMHSYQGPGYYNVFLEVTSVNGCIDTVSHPVYIEPEFAIYVPNAFSPNVDSRNEFFYPQGIGIDEDRYNMYIFDRWGELIFESNNFSKGWDGTAKGKSTAVQEDVYIWKIIAYDLKNNKHNLTGHVTVVR